MVASTSTALSSGVKRKRPHKHACGTPPDKCTGGPCGVSNGLKKSGKLHGSPQDAYMCYAKWLVSQGFTQNPMNVREFRDPKGGPTVFLTKKSRFGQKTRGGKADRQMPSNAGGATGGHIISN
jgi:hypothetical protein